jgi:hypothetical protein
MEKVIRIVQKGEDEGNLEYWLTLTGEERLKELETLRQQYHQRRYGARQGLQRVYRIVKRA